MSLKTLITSKEHEEALEKFKTRMADLNQPVETLARFLIAREFNIDRAEAMLSKNLIWRKENNIDNLVNEFVDDNEFNRELPYKITGFDNLGGLIIFCPLGIWNSVKWLNGDRTEEFFRWSIRQMEEGLVIAMNVKGHDPQQATYLVDLDHLSYTQAIHYPTLKMLYRVFQCLEQNYPESLKSIFVINTPAAYSIPFNFIKCILSARTQAKLKVFDNNKTKWIEELKKLAPRRSLPQQYFDNE